MTWSATVLTLFPEMFQLDTSISVACAAEDLGRAFDVRDIRDHGLGKHRTVDDTPAGGGPGRCAPMSPVRPSTLWSAQGVR